MPQQKKWCRKCDQIKPLAAFTRRMIYCKACGPVLYREKKERETQQWNKFKQNVHGIVALTGCSWEEACEVERQLARQREREAWQSQPRVCIECEQIRERVFFPKKAFICQDCDRKKHHTRSLTTTAIRKGEIQVATICED